MKKNLRFILLISVFLTVCLQTKAVSPTTANVITNVPAYYWYHGCTPTAIAMVFGYWALQGYTNLFDAQGSALYSTTNVQDQISSPAHNAKYDSNPDVSDAILPIPPNTSIACWLKTSVGQAYGETSVLTQIPAITNYSKYKGYSFSATGVNFSTSTTWPLFTNEVNKCRPMLFNVDRNGDGTNDHVVIAFGYDDRGPTGSTTNRWYACYTTDYENESQIEWKKFQTKAVSNMFGIVSTVQIIPPALPPPPIPKKQGTLVSFCSN